MAASPSPFPQVGGGLGSRWAGRAWECAGHRNAVWPWGPRASSDLQGGAGWGGGAPGARGPGRRPRPCGRPCTETPPGPGRRPRPRARPCPETPLCPGRRPRPRACSLLAAPAARCAPTPRV